MLFDAAEGGPVVIPDDLDLQGHIDNDANGRVPNRWFLFQI